MQTPEDFAAFLTQLGQQPRFALDLETTSLNPHDAQIVGVAIAWKEAEAWYLALRGPAGEKLLDPVQTLVQLKPIFEDSAVAKINQNIKYDWQVLRAQGIELAGVVGDPMIADYLLHAGERSHGLDVMAEKHLGHRVIPITDLIGKGKKQLCMDQVSAARIAEYAGEDVDVAWRLASKLEAMLGDLGLMAATANPQAAALQLYEHLEIPLIGVLADMEYTGIRLDVPLLTRLGAEMEQTLAGLEQEIYTLAGKKFNIGSVKQLRDILFKEMGLKSGKRTAIGGVASTNQETLERFARQGVEFARKLLDHRKIAKLKSTYVDALPALVHAQTGRVHASFNQTVAATGRLSSSEPNLQNIPIRSEQGGQIRQAFLPEEGWLLLTADYSQIELRLLAHFSGDEALRQAFAEDQDIHTLVAAQIFSTEPDDVSAAMRRVAKTVNFGVIYGMSCLRVVGPARDRREAGGGFHRRLFREISARARLSREAPRRVPASAAMSRRSSAGGRAITMGARPGEVDVSQPKSAGARGDQHGDPGVGRGFDQDGDAQRSSPLARGTAACPTADADSRRAGLRGASGRARGHLHVGARGNDRRARRPAGGADQGGHGHRTKLAGDRRSRFVVTAFRRLDDRIKAVTTSAGVNEMSPPVVGIVGGIGSGKSLVAAQFAAQGGHLIAADQLGHEALRQPDVKAQVVARWGAAMLDSDGQIDRKRLAAIVFADASERQALEVMTHPIIGQRIREEIAKACARPDVRLVVLDAAVMLEAGWHGVCDHVVFVDAPWETRLTRLMEKRGWNADELQKREQAQMPVDDKRRHADAIVENNGAPDQVASKVKELLTQWGL